MSWMTPHTARRSEMLPTVQQVQRFADAIGAEVWTVPDTLALVFHLPALGIRFTVARPTLASADQFASMLAKAYVDACQLMRQTRAARWFVGEHEGEWLA